jgi:hypothetical protein
MRLRNDSLCSKLCAELTPKRMNHPAATCGGIEGRCVSIAECRVGRGAQRRNSPLRTMGFAESTLREVEGLNPPTLDSQRSKLCGINPKRLNR